MNTKERQEKMNIYFAPLEGITGYIYRNAHHEFFTGIDKYFTPFISPNQNRALSPKEINDIKPEHNKGMYVVPQILTNKAEHFVQAAKELQEIYGYEEVNLNLGCPSGTVVSKGKGAGFLAKKDELDEFLQEIYAKTNVKISIKTRIGVDKPDEFYDLMAIFNQYPVHELIVHPRVQKDYYNNVPNIKMFAEAVYLSKQNSEAAGNHIDDFLCYNGDIFTTENYNSFEEEFPTIDKVMLGRGLLVNPMLAERIKGNGKDPTRKEAEGREDERTRDKTTKDRTTKDKERLRSFHDSVCEGYREVLSGDINVLFKMKELWYYMSHSFADSEKYLKKIRKTKYLSEYDAIIKELFEKHEIVQR